MAAYFLGFLKVQGRSGHHGIEWEEERGQELSSDTFPKAAGSQSLFYFYSFNETLVILLYMILHVCMILCPFMYVCVCVFCR